MTKFFTIAILAAATMANAAGLNFTFFDSFPRDNVFDVYVEVTGDTSAVDGLLNFDLGLDGLVAAGIDSSAVSFTPVVFGNLSESFQPQGFPDGNFIQGPSGDDIWSAGHSQFNAANPIAGIGISDVNEPGSSVVPDNPLITFGVPALLGTLDLSSDTAFSIAELEPLFSAGGTLYAGGDAGTPITPDSIGITVIPEPSTVLLAGLALAGFAARRK